MTQQEHLSSGLIMRPKDYICRFDMPRMVGLGGHSDEPQRYIHRNELLRVDHGHKLPTCWQQMPLLAPFKSTANFRLIKDRTWPSQRVLPVV